MCVFWVIHQQETIGGVFPLDLVVKADRTLVGCLVSRRRASSNFQQRRGRAAGADRESSRPLLTETNQEDHAVQVSMGASCSMTNWRTCSMVVLERSVLVCRTLLDFCAFGRACGLVLEVHFHDQRRNDFIPTYVTTWIKLGLLRCLLRANRKTTAKCWFARPRRSPSCS